MKRKRTHFVNYVYFLCKYVYDKLPKAFSSVQVDIVKRIESTCCDRMVCKINEYKFVSTPPHTSKYSKKRNRNDRMV